VEVRARAKRPPLGCIELLAEPEGDFRTRVAELEDEELFGTLVRQGVVRRRGGRGRMPPERYEEYMDEQLVRFVQRYRLDDRPGWRDDFLAAGTERDRSDLAARYGIPAGELGRMCRYLRRQQAETTARRSAREPAADLADFVPGGAEADLTLPIEVVRHFVETHGLTETDLVTDFLHGESDSAALAEKYSATSGEIASVRDAVDTVLIADAAAGPPAPAPSRHPPDAEPARPVALVTRDERGATLRLLDEAGYAMHYLLDPGALDDAALTPDEREEAAALLDELRWVNQRRSLVSRLVAHIFAHQRAYFDSGDELALRPLAQAELARALGEHPSTVCRALPDKRLQTPEGVFELKHYCQPKRDVVRRLAGEYPQLSDRQLQRLLEQKHGCRIARRTVAYHRRGRQR
jgi:hypothetical protein